LTWIKAVAGTALPALGIASLSAGESQSSLYAGVYPTEPIEIVAERYPRLQADAANTRDVINREAIRDSHQTEISYLLEEKLNINIHKPGIGALSGLSIRGISGGRNNNKSRVIVDGVPIDTLRRGFNLESIDIQTVERIDLIRGPSSALYGGGATNGTLHITTRLPQDRKFEFGAGAGSYDTKTSHLYYQDKAGHFAWRVNSNYLDTNGHEHVDGDKMINPAWLTNEGAYLEYADDKDIFTMNYRNFNTKRNEATYSMSNGAVTGIDKDIEENITYSYLTWQRNLARSKLHIRTFLTTDRDQSLISPLSRASTQGGSLEWQADLPMDAQFFLGSDYEDSHIRSNSPSSRATQQYAAPFAQLSVPVWRERLTFLAGVRYDNNSKFADQWSPKYGVVCKILPDLTARAGLNYGYRAPTVTELYSTSARAFGNKNLRPDKNRQYELGIGYEKKRGGIDVSAFMNEEMDMIVSQAPAAAFTYNGQNVQKQYRNVDGKSIYRGVETRGHVTFLQYFEASAGYSYLDPGTLTFHTDKNTIQSGLAFKNSRLSTEVNLTHAGGRYMSDYFAAKRDAYTVYNWNANVRLTRSLRYHVRINNFTDETYALNFYDPMPGRTYLTGVDFSF